MTKKLPGSSLAQAKLVTLLLDPKKPIEMRAKMFIDLFFSNVNDPDGAYVLAVHLLKTASQNEDALEAKKMAEAFKEKLAELERSAARPATFIEPADTTIPGGGRRVHVVTPDGQDRYPLLHENLELQDLVRGMTVFLDDKGILVTGTSSNAPRVGQLARLVGRRRGTDEIEVSFRDEKLLLYAGQAILDGLKNGTITRGARILFCLHRQFAFDAMPAEEERSRRFIDLALVPDVVASRDIGDPHWILERLIRHTRVLLERKDLMDAFDFRPGYRVLMTGPSGTGKSLTISAFIRIFTRMLAERTGREEVSNRTIWVKLSDLLSKWFGESDKLIDALMDDLYEAVSEEVVTARGERIRLPVVLVMEEAEGLGRRRGEGGGDVYDRVIGTLLQRLSGSFKDLGPLPVIMIATTNRPEMFDSAMLRRLGGTLVTFDRLTRRGTAAVLGKKMKRHFPYATRNGESQEAARQYLIDEVVSTLYSPNGDDQGVVEATLREGGKVLFHRRAFLTGAVIEQAVANAINHSVFASMDQGDRVPLCASTLLDALYAVVDSLADTVTVHNASDYLDVPDYPGVAGIRRLRDTRGHLAHVTH
jgi:SpoVK/Ycf46/Vps4 family AAA+-type ATPase